MSFISLNYVQVGNLNYMIVVFYFDWMILNWDIGLIDFQGCIQFYYLKLFDFC